MPIRVRSALVIVALVLIVAACGGGDESETEPQAEETPATSASPSPVRTPAPTPTPGPEPITAIPLDGLAWSVAIGNGRVFVGHTQPADQVWARGVAVASVTQSASFGVSVFDLEGKEAGHFDIAEFPERLTYDEELDCVWVSAEGSDSEECFDYETFELTSDLKTCDLTGKPYLEKGEVPVPGVTYCHPGDIAPGSLWVSEGDVLFRIDPAGAVLASIPIPGLSLRIAVGGGSVWALADQDESPRVVRVDEDTETVVAEISLPGRASGVVFGAGGVWVIFPPENGSPAKLVRIDPATNDVAATIALDYGPVNPAGFGRLAVGEGAVWVTYGTQEKQDSLVLGIDPSTNSVTAEVPIAGFLSDVAIGGGAVWVTADDALIRIDPAFID